MLKRFTIPVVAAAALALTVAGCGSSRLSTTTRSAAGPTTSTLGVSSAAPRLVVCGEPLSTSAAGPVVYDIASHRYPPVSTVTAGGVIYVQVSNSGTTGRVVKITPPTAFATVRTVWAADGRAVAVELRPGAKPVAVLSATPPGHGNEGIGIAVLRLDITSAPSDSPPRCRTPMAPATGPTVSESSGPCGPYQGADPRSAQSGRYWVRAASG